MSRIKVSHDQYTKDTSEADTDDPWDRPDTYTEHVVDNYVELVDDSEYYDFVATRHIERGKEYYLLFAVYSTGDSFGHDTDRDIEFFDLYENEDVAEKNAGILRQVSGFSVDLIDDNGNAFNHCTPWNGYFEYLSYVNVQKVTVQ